MDGNTGIQEVDNIAIEMLEEFGLPYVVSCHLCLITGNECMMSSTCLTKTRTSKRKLQILLGKNMPH